MPAILPAAHRAGQLDGAGIQQQLLGQRRFSGVGMGNDGERSPARDFTLELGQRGRIDLVPHVQLEVDLRRPRVLNPLYRRGRWTSWTTTQPAAEALRAKLHMPPTCGGPTGRLRRPARHSIHSCWYGAAIALVALTAWMRWLTEPVLGESARFLPFVLVVAILHLRRRDRSRCSGPRAVEPGRHSPVRQAIHSPRN